MIAIISSTLNPSASPSHDGPRTNLDPALRLQQTIASVQSLTSLGFGQIFLADNSPQPPSAAALASLNPAQVFHFNHPAFRNKGIGEANLLLSLCEHLPASQPIMKLSGRYYADKNLCIALGDFDLVGKFSQGKDRGAENLSTRAYAVRDRDFLAKFLRGTLDEIYASPWRIVGPRSLLTVARQLLQPMFAPTTYSDPTASLEICAARWLRRNQIQVLKLDEIGINGVLGSWINPPVKE